MYRCVCVVDDWSDMDLAEVLKAMPPYSYIDIAQPGPDAIEMLEAASEKIH